MSRTWEHPELGTFNWDDDQWVGMIEVPAWAVYRQYRDDEDEERVVQGDAKVLLQFIREEDDGIPSEAQVAAALSFVKHSPTLATAVVDAIWDDFNGEGPGSGYWWVNDLDQVNENAEYDPDAKPIKSREDVRDSLMLMSVSVGYQHESAVEITFGPWWEEEHNLGVLVHEDKVIGLGYQLDVEPFGGDHPSWPKSERPVINPFTGKPIPPKE